MIGEVFPFRPVRVAPESCIRLRFFWNGSKAHSTILNCQKALCPTGTFLVEAAQKAARRVGCGVICSCPIFRARGHSRPDETGGTSGCGAAQAILPLWRQTARLRSGHKPNRWDKSGTAAGSTEKSPFDKSGSSPSSDISSLVMPPRVLWWCVVHRLVPFRYYKGSCTPRR